MPLRVAEYDSYKDLGGSGEWDSGILRINLDRWEDFHSEITVLLKLGNFIWRGQRCDWPLKSKFDRIIKFKRDHDRDVKLDEQKRSFVRAVKGRRGSNPPDLSDYDTIWSLGQHYGLATPLLDWSESPFVSAYFALIEKPSDNIQNAIPVKDQDNKISIDPDQENRSFRFVYGLSKDLGRWGPAKSEESEPIDRYVRFVETLSDENPRLLNQRGLFTSPLSGEIDIGKTVLRCYANDLKKGIGRIIFVKIKIPDTYREDSLKNLNSMNINHATLFPDLIGAAEYCNTKLEIEDYS